MTVPIILFAVGLLCLIKGGDWFVDGAAAGARPPPGPSSAPPGCPPAPPGPR